jgi:hypothetical protein
MLSYDVLSTMIASKLYSRFADLSPLYNFLWQLNANSFIQFANIIFSKPLLDLYFTSPSPFTSSLFRIKSREG